MAKQTSGSTPFPYGELWGREFFDALAEGGDVFALTTLWHLGDPEHCSSLLPYLLDSDDPDLGDLVALEVVEERIAGQLQTALVQTLPTSERPPLSAAVVDRLLEKLCEEETGPEWYEPIRPQLASWAIDQQTAAAAAYALRVLASEVPGCDDEDLRAAARARVAREPEAFDKAHKAQLTLLGEEEITAEAWEEGAALYEAGAGAARLQTALKPLGERLLTAAESYCTAEKFQPFLRHFLQEKAASRVLDVLADGDADGPGLGALAEAGLADECQGKLAFLATVAGHRPALWPLAVAGADDWSLTEWRRRLKALKPQLADEVAGWLVENAPIAAMRELLTVLVGRQVEGGEVADLEALGERLKEHLAEIDEYESGEASEGEDDEEEDEEPEPLDLLSVLPWQAAREEQGRERLNALLDSTLEPAEQARLVAKAQEANKLKAEIAVELIPEDCEEEALESVATGPARARLCQALLEARQAETLEAVGRLQEARFALDLVEPVASVAPAQALRGAANAYHDLRQDDRDQLVEQLEKIGTADDLPLLEAVLADSHQKATVRRVRAADRVGELIPARGAIPATLVELLNSGKPQLREAAIRNIERVKPRDLEVIAQLRAVARAGGVPGKLSNAALEAIAADIIDDLGPETEEPKALELLPLLGATGQPCVLKTLFLFVGENAIWDSPAVRRTAASALAAATDGISDVSLDDQMALVALIEGDGPEVDPQALDSLNEARSRLLLQGDEALAILYNDFLDGKAPTVDPGVLFGPEKTTLLTHLQLYSQAKVAKQRGRQISQLDIIAAALARAAYLHFGTSEPLKSEIRASLRQENYGNLIKALSSVAKMNKLQPSFQTIHDLRSEKGQEAHPGGAATEADLTEAQNAMGRIVTACVQLLKEATSP